MPGNKRVDEFRVLDAVGADEAQGRVHQVRREHEVLLARENLLDAAVVVEVHVFIFMLLDECVDIATIVVYFPEFLEKFGKFFSNHMLSPFRDAPVRKRAHARSLL